MSYTQENLDFDGSNPELQERLRWATNAAAERARWTPERRCLAWMIGNNPDESDIAWWNAQPRYKRQNWLDLLEREGKRMKLTGEWRRPFHIVSQEWEERLSDLLAEDERRIASYMDILRADFMAGRPCSISFDIDKSHHGDHSRYLLRQALDRLAIPQTCLQ